MIATAATAGAASLITGRRIKNGSIGVKDLSKPVRAQLRKAAVRGAQGLQGPKGDVGPAGPLTTTLPAGHTLRGVFNLDSTAAGGGAVAGAGISFGLSLRSAPTIVVRSVNAPANSQCPGSVGNPQAAPGVVCF